MNKYQEAEKELAELLGFTRIYEVQGTGAKITITYPDGTRDCNVPRWCSDDAEAFKLMVEYDLRIYIFKTFVDIDHIIGMFVKTGQTLYKDHPDKATAVRYAIVQAVIAKLKSAS